MHWISGGRVVSILSDVSQIIVTPQILKAVFVGLRRPQGHKFHVTAKGGDRGGGFVEWGIMRQFAVLIGVTILAIVYAFDVNGRADALRYSGPALAWSWYNLLALVALCFVCIEQPRQRSAERIDSRQLATIRSPSGDQNARLADLSITGARILGKPPRKIGERIELRFFDCRVEATIVRITAEDFAVAFLHTFETRIAMIRHFYAGASRKRLGPIRAFSAGAAVLRRVLG
jgi:cellulose synthase (UDP-forming)